MGINIGLGNDPDHRRGLQDLAPGVHHQLLLDSRGEAHCIPERGGARLGDLYEFGGSKAVALDTMSALAELVYFPGDVQRKPRQEVLDSTLFTSLSGRFRVLLITCLRNSPSGLGMNQNFIVTIRFFPPSEHCGCTSLRRRADYISRVADQRYVKKVSEGSVIILVSSEEYPY